MTLYTAVILKENNKFFLKTGCADILSETVIKKLGYIVTFIQNNLYESQIAWHYNSNISLFEIVLKNGAIKVVSPYLKFIYSMPVWRFKIKSLLKEITKECNGATNELVV